MPQFDPYQLELEFIDIGRCHDLGRPEHHFAILAHGVVTKAPGCEFFAFLPGDLARRNLLGDLIGQVAEVGHIPPDILGLTGQDVLLHERRGRKTGELDFAQEVGLLQCAGGGRQADTGRNYDSLEIREGLDQRQCLLLVDLLAARSPQVLKLLDTVTMDEIEGPVQHLAVDIKGQRIFFCLLYTSPSPRDGLLSRMPSSA